MAEIDFSSFPVVDSHCHAFLPEKETKPFEAYLTLSDLQQRREDLTSTMLNHMVMRELSRILRVKGEDIIIAERQRRMESNPADYIELLFDDAGIETLLVDSGYPFKETAGYGIDLSDFSKMVGRDVREIFRLETALHGLLKSLVPFNQANEDFRKQIREAVSNGCVSLKTIIAYRTGLDIRPWDESFVKNSWGKMIAMVRGGNRPASVLSERNERNKSVYDSFLVAGIEEANRLAVPVQIHTGMGDSPSMDIRIANPAHLYDLLQDPRAREARLVLTHGGYPYLEEAAFLANAYPNVYIDLSETIPIVSVGLRNRLLTLLEMTPTTKIMYGSDGFNVPELHWFSAILTKKALTAILIELMEHEGLSEEEATSIGGAFLSGNAKRLYSL
ncbi:MAG: amidohydrolase family protein [Candidatus Bathyarchaeota archaeon]|nr:amidohydrolase family protein [Candidatus Bathyarchaeota archaeon]